MGYPVEVALDDDRRLVVELSWPQGRWSLDCRDGFPHYDLPAGAQIEAHLENALH